MPSRALTSALLVLLLNGVTMADDLPVLVPATLAPSAVEPQALASAAVEPTVIKQPYPGRFWVDTELLLWWMKPANLPPLITGSVPGTPLGEVGVLGVPGTFVLFGGSPVNGDLRVGGRVTAGFWLDCDQTCGIQGYFFQLGTQAQGFNGGSPGLLGRPFVNTVTGLPDAELISSPGFLNGNVQANASSGSLIGAGVLGRCNLCCGCRYRLDALAGYRYLSWSDRVGITENLTSTDPAQTVVPLGTNIVVADRFQTINHFNGADFGLAGEIRWSSWALIGTARIAFGATHEQVDINGFTTVTVPGFPPVTSPGGLLALSSNSGVHTRDMFAVVPEVGLQLAYQVGPHLRVHAGYNFLYWSQLARAGDQIDLVVNPALLPPHTPGALPARPAFMFNGTSIWAQGINLGLEFRF
jgi:hypothetical protein